MAVKSSGQLSFNTDIVGEFGGSAPHSLSEYKRGGSLVPSGPSANSDIPTTNSNIQFSDFYGAIQAVTFSISSNQTGLDLESYLITAGWDQTTPVILGITSSTYIYSTSTSTPALYISSAFNNLLTIENAGYIMGMGGQGGYRTTFPSYAGGAGGDAIECDATGVIIKNFSDILGGGGGGAGGRNYSSSAHDTSHGGGGAGGGTGGGSLSGRTGGAGGTPGNYGADGLSNYTGGPGQGGAQGGGAAGPATNNGGGGGGGGRIPATILLSGIQRYGNGGSTSGGTGGTGGHYEGPGNVLNRNPTAGVGVNCGGGGGGYGQAGGANNNGDAGGAAGSAVSGSGSWSVDFNSGVIAGSY